jgi:hypothetical protein
MEERPKSPKYLRTKDTILVYDNGAEKIFRDLIGKGREQSQG